jgi:hypothetical protein
MLALDSAPRPGSGPRPPWPLACVVWSLCAWTGVVLAQGAPAKPGASAAVSAPTRTITQHQADPANARLFLAYEDARGCVERVREAESHWHNGAPTIYWSGGCKDGLREGDGTLKLYSARQVLVVSSGRYVNGFRSGPWLWEFPDGRKLEARFGGNGRDPAERVLENAKGERFRQLLQSDGSYVDDAGISPPPEMRMLAVNAPVNTDASRRLAKPGEGATYASAHFRVASCAGKARVDSRHELAATRRDIDRFVREGDAALRAEVAADLELWSKSMATLAVRAAAYAGGTTDAGDALRKQLRGQLNDARDRYDWARCHYNAGLPYLARMIQSVPVCERASLFKLDAVRASGNPRLQAEFADCLQTEIHSARWGR